MSLQPTPKEVTNVRARKTDRKLAPVLAVQKAN
jgi:hypothetical protein